MPALFPNFLLLLSHKGTANAGPNSASRSKITPLRADVKRANKVTTGITIVAGGWGYSPILADRDVPPVRASFWRKN